MQEEVQEPVGGGAVDVDHLADAAFNFSCLLPETHDMVSVSVEILNELLPVAPHHHEAVVEDGHREVGARFQHIGHLASF